MKVLVLGISGMLGNAMYRVLSDNADLEVYGTARSGSVNRYFPIHLHKNIAHNVDVENQDSLIRAISKIRPDVVVNCIGLIKQLDEADNPLVALPINAMLPHRLARICELTESRLIHVSTDCVFSGRKGNYLESDPSDAYDLYGKSKHIGEVTYPHAITLRTSIIGHELNSQLALLGWFLAQNGEVRGFTNAIFSGLPTQELARVISNYVIPRPEMHGLYHVATKPINKHDLLCYIAKTYKKDITIIPDPSLVIDRSLNAGRFNAETGYVPPEWPQLIEEMLAFNFQRTIV